MFNETALKIGALERGDSGVYGARIKLHPALVEDRSFNLSGSERLPDPKIQSWLLSKSPAWCHLTPRCHVPSGTGGTVAWMKPQWGTGGCQGASPLQRGAPRWGAARLPQHQPRAWPVLEERSRSTDLAGVCWSGGEGGVEGSEGTVRVSGGVSCYLQAPTSPTKGCFSSHASPRCGPFPVAGDGIGPGCWTTVAAAAPRAATLPRWSFPKSPCGTVPDEKGRGDGSDLHVRLHRRSQLCCPAGSPCRGDVPRRHVPRTAAQSHGRSVPAAGSGSGSSPCQRERRPWA
ncbi:uncharacterized protein LOC142094156 [Calonectris borealis]|uniref:uncharacterized protein LOC142094156 n=1 Tax=Calonectris borealis TaxID=1323832 RepID=UPI003F4B84BB